MAAGAKLRGGDTSASASPSSDQGTNALLPFHPAANSVVKLREFSGDINIFTKSKCEVPQTDREQFAEGGWRV